MEALLCSKARTGAEPRGKDGYKFPMNNKSWSPQGVQLSSGTSPARTSRVNSSGIGFESEPYALDKGQEVVKKAQPKSIPRPPCGEVLFLRHCSSSGALSSIEGLAIGSSSQHQMRSPAGAFNPTKSLGVPSSEISFVCPWQTPQGYGQPVGTRASGFHRCGRSLEEPRALPFLPRRVVGYRGSI
jgi:hypothetical protein